MAAPWAPNLVTLGLNFSVYIAISEGLKLGREIYHYLGRTPDVVILMGVEIRVGCLYKTMGISLGLPSRLRTFGYI